MSITWQGKKVCYLDAQEDYKNCVSELQKRTQEKIQVVQDEFERHLSDFYSANGNRLGDGMARLLNSGIKLSGSEIDSMVDQSRNNPTMLRLISDHCERVGIKNQNAQMLGILARKAGEDERKMFKDVAGMVKNAVSESEITSEIWSKEDSHFKRLSDEAIGSMNGMWIHPAAAEKGEQ